MKSSNVAAAREILDKFPDISTRAAARMLTDQLMISFESARSAVKQIRGLTTTAPRVKRTHPGKPNLPPIPRPGKELPVGKINAFGAHNLPAGKWLVISDLHIPYHNAEVIKDFVAYAKKKHGAEHVLFNGDFADCHAVSRWEDDPRKRDFPGELEANRQALAWFREKFPGGELVFKQGNHEERLERFMWSNAPQFLGIKEFELSSLFRFADFGVTEVKDKIPVKAGDLFIIHGHEYRFAVQNPVNPARGLFLRAKTSALCGHFHQPSGHSASRLGDERISCWSTGCACDLHPDYMRLNEWSHGAAVVECEASGDFVVHNFKLVGSNIYPA